MNSLKIGAIALIALAVLAPMSGAHSPAGTPKTYCQTSDMYEHDYVGGNGRLFAFPQDGNLEECSTPTYGLFLFSEEDCDTLAVADGTPVYTLACQTDRPADWDGDYDWAIGGAVLAAYSAPGRSAPCLSPDSANACSSGGTMDPTHGGSLYCWDMQAHHPEGSTVSVQDTVLLGGVGITVTSDWRRVASDGSGLTDQNECGDSLVEECDSTDPASIDQVTCNSRDGSETSPAPAGTGTPPIGFPATNSVVAPATSGQDGVYIVFISGGTAGHIWT